MKQLGLAMVQYTQDNDNRLPLRQEVGPGGRLASWRSEIYPYVKSQGVYRCPSNVAAQWPDIERDGFPRSYAVNSSTGGLHNVGGPFSDRHPALSIEYVSATATTIAVVESTSAFNDFNPLFPAAFAEPTREGHRTGHLFGGHTGFTNLLFIDGHAKWMHPLDTLNVHPFGTLDTVPNVNGWTIDGSPFIPPDQATATATLQYGIAMAKSDNQ